MTLIQKIISILKRQNKPTNLKTLYDELEEHPHSSIRGNLYRYLKKDDCEIQKISEGVYSFIEILKVMPLEDGNKSIDYTAHYFADNNEIHSFHKDYVTTEDVKEGIYVNQKEFSSFDELETNAKSLKAFFAKGDSIEILKHLRDNCMDLLITDPPYRVISGGNKHEKGNCSGMLSKNDGKIFNHNNIKFSD